MRSFIKMFWLALMAIFFGCAPPNPGIWDTADTGNGWVASEKTISSTQVETLIAAGRAEIGSTSVTYTNNCKEWVRRITTSALGSSYTIPGTASSDYSWSGSSTSTCSSTYTTQPCQVAQWIGSYANKRYVPGSLANGASSSTTYTESNGDPQVVVLYAPSSGVKATLSKGSTSVSATTSSSSGTTGGVVSSSASGSTGTWTLTVKNSSGATIATGITAVALSYSRFQSDWQTARRGDIMQMRVDAGSNKCDNSGRTPHTTFVQVDYNAGTNWLDANWGTGSASPGIREHAISMETMMKMVACNSDSGFTVYRIN